MLDTTTKKRIDDCRDILVGKLPDPKAQIEQITIGLIYKFMDDMDKEAIDLGGKAKFFSDYTIPDPKDEENQITVPFSNYSWDRLFDTKVTASEMLRLYSEAIEGMEKNPNIPQLFRDIFSNAYLPYRDPETLKLFLKTIGEFEYTHSEKLGDAFEYLLSVMGSQGDAGQFRTPRHIIDFLVAIVDPSKTDTIMDPACGTAGFLISAFKYLKEKNNNQFTPDEQKKIIKNFVGYDISPDMVRLSLVNLYLHGFTEPHIYEYDTLSSEDRWNENFDVILANPPFMSPKGGIRPHKKFTIQSKRSEVLFVDYIAEHLNPKGRAGIIVPEGIIFQSGTAYKELRKMLVENYLYGVVSLPAGVFNPYSGVKTSILLLDKELAKKSNEILFIKIENDGFSLGSQRNPIKGGQLEEATNITKVFRKSVVEGSQFQNTTIAHSVDKKEIGKNGDYNLSGERYLVNEFVTNSSFDIVTVDEICDLVRGSSPRPKGDPLYYGGKVPRLMISDITRDGMYTTPKTDFLTQEGAKKSRPMKKGEVIMAVSGNPGLATILLVDACIHDGFVGFRNLSKNILPEFFYFVLVHQKKINNSQSIGAVFKNLNTSQIKQFKVPLPSLSIQEEIVTEIEGYQKIIDGAKMVVDNYKPKIEIDPDWEMVDLGSICENLDSKRVPVTKSDRKEGPYPYYGASGQVDSVNDYIFDEDLLLISEDGANLRARTYPIAFSISGKTWVNNHAHVLRFKKFEHQKYVEYYINSISVEPYVTGAAQPKMNQKSLNSIKIPFNEDSISDIVTQIEKEQALVNANQELIEIFEQKIKDRIAKVWGE